MVIPLEIELGQECDKSSASGKAAFQRARIRRGIGFEKPMNSLDKIRHIGVVGLNDELQDLRARFFRYRYPGDVARLSVGHTMHLVIHADSPRLVTGASEPLSNCRISIGLSDAKELSIVANNA
jgi:hypothetical protein